jgi:hypothetical protein
MSTPNRKHGGRRPGAGRPSVIAARLETFYHDVWCGDWCWLTESQTAEAATDAGLPLNPKQVRRAREQLAALGRIALHFLPMPGHDDRRDMVFVRIPNLILARVDRRLLNRSLDVIDSKEINETSINSGQNQVVRNPLWSLRRPDIEYEPELAALAESVCRYWTKEYFRRLGKPFHTTHKQYAAARRLAGIHGSLSTIQRLIAFWLDQEPRSPCLTGLWNEHDAAFSALQYVTRTERLSLKVHTRAGVEERPRVVCTHAGLGIEALLASDHYQRCTDSPHSFRPTPSPRLLRLIKAREEAEEAGDDSPRPEDVPYDRPPIKRVYERKGRYWREKRSG